MKGKKKYRNPTEVAESKFSTSICIISQIIHDGVKSRGELVRKFAAVTNRSLENADDIISLLEKRGECGFYATITINGCKYNSFVLWNGKAAAFPPSKEYLAPDYFKDWFRGKKGQKKNNYIPV